MTETDKTFIDLGLRAELTDTLNELGYERPTPIQANTIPLLMKGGDVIGQAQTGTGKTAAFALPLLEKVDPSDRSTQALVLTPTRELAMQVAEAIHTYSKRLPSISVLPVYGGAPMVTQLKRLERGVQVVVGTPGRLIDHLDRGTLDLSKLKMIVLDEADEMLKMGFQEEVEQILKAAAPERQVALFSATMPDEIIKISKRYLRNPNRVEIEHHAVTAPAIEQRFLNLSEGQKLNVLTQILELEPSEGVLIFRRTKNGAAELAEKLEARGFPAAAMHGDMTQTLRESVIRRLKSGQVEIVVATDVAARGLDVESLTHVINYDVPYDVEAYVHRIGRTGRAGRSGMATIFVTPRERRMLREIERYTGAQIKPMKMPTAGDVAQRRLDTFKDSLRKGLEDGDLDLYLSLIEELVDEGKYDAAEIAAAAARLANGSRSLSVRAAAEEIPERTERAQREFTPSSSRDDARPRAPRAASSSPTRAASSSSTRTPRPGDDEPKVKLALSVGRNDGIRPADIVGSIANEADIPGREIGPIDIHDDVTVVALPEKYTEKVLAKTARAQFRGRPLNVRVASDREANLPRSAPRGGSDESMGQRAARAYRGAEARDRDAKTGGYDRAARPAFKPRSEGASDRPAFKRRDEGSDSRPARAPYNRDDARPARPAFKRDEDDAPREYAPRAIRPAFKRPGDSPRPFAARTERPAYKKSDAPVERTERPAYKRTDAPAGRTERPAYKRSEAPAARTERPTYKRSSASSDARPAKRYEKRDDRGGSPAPRGGAFSKFASKGPKKRK